MAGKKVFWIDQESTLRIGDGVVLKFKDEVDEELIHKNTLARLKKEGKIGELIEAKTAEDGAVDFSAREAAIRAEYEGFISAEDAAKLSADKEGAEAALANLKLKLVECNTKADFEAVVGSLEGGE